MQTTNNNNESNTTPPDRVVARLTPELRTLLAALAVREDLVCEHGVLPVLNMAGLAEARLVHYPSPLLGGLLSELPELFEAHVLPLLDFTARTVIALTSHRCCDVVRGSRGFTPPGKPKRKVGKALQAETFVTSKKRLGWAKNNGMPWTTKTFELAVLGNADLATL
jgi:hypothetical protein